MSMPFVTRSFLKRSTKKFIAFILSLSFLFSEASSNDLGVLTLKQALDFAMQNNHHVKSAISTLPIAEAKLIIAKYRPNPYLGSFNELVKGGALHPAQLGAPFEIGRKRHYRIKVAKEQISKTELEIAKVLWEVHTQVHSAYAELAIYLELYNLAKDRVKFYEALVDIASKRLQAGDISTLDLIRAEMELLKTENELSEVEGKLKRARVEFNHSLGRDPSQEIVLDDLERLKPKIKLQDYPNLNDILDQAIVKRLEVAILEKEYGIVRAELKKAKWERIPNVNIEGAPAGTNMVWGGYIGAQLEVPVFNRRQGEIKQAKAQLAHLEKEEDRIKHDIKVEVRDAIQDLGIREEQISRFQEKLLGSAEDILEMIKIGYQKGKLSLTDTLNAEQQNRTIKERYLGSLLNYQIALATLEYVVGVPLNEFKVGL